MSGSAAPSPAIKSEPRSPQHIRSTVVVSPPSSTASPSSSAVKKQASPEPEPAPPTGYRDIPLLSTSTKSPWTHHLVRFAHHNRIDPTDQAAFIPPLKLNRKVPPKVKSPAPKPGDPVLDRYNKPIKLQNGEFLKWPKAGDDLTEHKKHVDKLKPQEKAASAQYDASLVAPSATAANRSNKKPLFQKRVRQIHKASATARRIHNDESLPWVLEDFETHNNWESARTGRKDNIFALARHFDDGGKGLDEALVPKEPKEEEQDKKPAVADKLTRHAPWIGKLEGGDSSLQSSESSFAQVLFVFDDRDQGGFKVVPIRKTYRFMQKSRFRDDKGDEEREKSYAKAQKSSDIAPIRVRALGADAGGESSAGGSSYHGFSGSGGGGGGGLGLPGSFGSRGGGGGGGGSGSSSAGGGSSGFKVKKEELDDEAWANLHGLSLGATASEPAPSRSRGLISVSGGGRRGRGGGMEHRRGDDDGGTFDELDYQEDFADDEERMGGEAELVEDSEAREMEERLKREMARAGFGGDADAGVEDDDMFGDAEDGAGRREDDQLTGSGRQMKKIMKALSRRAGGAEDYESDEEVNPYASEESDDEEVAMANPEEAMRRALEEKEREEKEAAKLGKTPAATNASTTAATPAPNGGKPASASSAPSAKASRSGTPAAANARPDPAKTIPHKNNKKRPHGGAHAHQAGHKRAGSGHVDLAKRATSNAAAAAAAAASGSGSRGASPAGSRSPSPGRDHAPRQSSPLASAAGDGAGAGTSGSLSNSGSTSSGLGTKRPASPVQSTAPHPSASKTRESSSSSFSASSSKRIKTESSAASSRASSPPRGPVSPLEAELIQLVRNNAVRSISEVISRFKKRLTERPELKGEMMAAFKKVLSGGTGGQNLRVKDGY